MNAYELATFLEADSWYKLVSRQEIVDMLRQQADRIAELEKDLHIIERHYDQLDKDVFSKPVAYRWKSDLGYIYDVFNHGNGEPLYTHTVKQLSDGEIMATLKNVGITEANLSDGNIPMEWMKDFARAVIKEITE